MSSGHTAVAANLMMLKGFLWGWRTNKKPSVMPARQVGVGLSKTVRKLVFAANQQPFTSFDPLFVYSLYFGAMNWQSCQSEESIGMLILSCSVGFRHGFCRLSPACWTPGHVWWRILCIDGWFQPDDLTSTWRILRLTWWLVVLRFLFLAGLLAVNSATLWQDYRLGLKISFATGKIWASSPGIFPVSGTH